MHKVGLRSVTNVQGAVFSAVPNVLGMCVFSSPLDDSGRSVKVFERQERTHTRTQTHKQKRMHEDKPNTNLKQQQQQQQQQQQHQPLQTTTTATTTTTTTQSKSDTQILKIDRVLSFQRESLISSGLTSSFYFVLC